MGYQCVPFNPDWVTSSKLDLKAIYRRPRREAETGEIMRDAAGVPQWDYTAGLPVRRHLDYVKKGYEYITLADMASLAETAPWLRSIGRDPKEFLYGRGPWNAKTYRATADAEAQDAHAELKTLVAEFGLEAVTAIKRQADSGWTPPADLIATAKGKAAK